MNRVKRFLFFYSGSSTPAPEPEGGIPAERRAAFMARSQSIFNQVSSYIQAHPALFTDNNAEGVWDTLYTYPGQPDDLHEDVVEKTTTPGYTLTSPQTAVFSMIDTSGFDEFVLTISIDGYEVEGGNFQYDYRSLVESQDGATYQVYGNIYGGTDPGVLNENYQPPYVEPVDETPPAIQNQSLSGGSVGEDIGNVAVYATGASPISYTATGLPAGLSMTSDGALHGTPTEGGQYTVHVVATNAYGVDEKDLSCFVSGGD